jgi:hypothetical protein
MDPDPDPANQSHMDPGGSGSATLEKGREGGERRVWQGAPFPHTHTIALSIPSCGKTTLHWSPGSFRSITHKVPTTGNMNLLSDDI